MLLEMWESCFSGMQKAHLQEHIFKPTSVSEFEKRAAELSWS